MKKIKHILLAFMTMLVINSFATVHTVSFGTSTNVMCFIGDTIRFKDMTFQPTMVSINTTSGPVVITSPMFTTPDGSGKIIDYVVTGNETAYQMNHSAASSSGTITVNTATGINSATKNDLSIRVYPNPAINELTVSTPIAGTLSIFNINSQLILTTQISAGESKVSIDTLPSGIYFVAVGNKYEKICKQ